MSISDLRREYEGESLDERDAAHDPIEQFQRWFTYALEGGRGGGEVNAMTVATCDGKGIPGARTVLLKEFDERGFVFFTNYASRKARELAANPRASLLFYWSPINRQVRIDGSVEKISRDETRAYFITRPRESQLSAWASPQSEVVESRAALEARFEEVAARFANVPVIEPPENWGGYRVIPQVIEFWQGRPARFHDRLRYTKQRNGSWTIERLAP
jgi:pyridoxamine 5'-phosphate oxidase